MQSDIALQAVATCMGSVAVSPTYMTLYFPATIQCIASCCSVYAWELQVQEPLKTCFTSHIFSAILGLLVSCIASCHILCMCFRFGYSRRVETELATLHCSQLQRVCYALFSSQNECRSFRIEKLKPLQRESGQAASEWEP